MVLSGAATVAAQTQLPGPPPPPAQPVQPDRMTPDMEPGEHPDYLVPLRQRLIVAQQADSPVAVTGQTTQQIVTDNALPDAFDVLDQFGDAEMAGGGDTAFQESQDVSPEVSAVDTSAEVTSLGAGIVVGRGRYKAGDVEGDVNSVNIPLKYDFNKRVRINVSLPVNYTKVKLEDLASMTRSDISIWSGGVLVSLGYGIAIPEDKKNYRWRVTPTAGFALTSARGENTGSWTLVGGLSSNYLYRIRKGWILNVGNAVTAFHSQRLRGEYESLANEDQVQLVNGVQLIHTRGRWIYNVFAIDNRFMQDAFVRNYQTYGVGGGYSIGRATSIRAFYYTDQGRDYSAHSVGVSSAWKF